MTRPDFALQMMLRTQRKDNQHENPDYQILASAIEELKRLYGMEALVKDFLNAETDGYRESTLDMIRDTLL